MTADDETGRPGNSVLKELATALGIPATAFFGGCEEGDRIAESVELLRLWATLDRAEQRREILDHLRRITEGRAAG
ncbi:hypothetical protein AFCDBAGC_0854 [Methylobacterium cerastii]|uniref:XRE family transcriptional regulator n=1 Tax=Methylobacterium cerastii TaxID=932741 RepID=A0ABQ4QDP1_9HYPH|nr:MULTISPECIES: hypothetical protein [Methylobacterium]TXM91665.1 hypothetical protein FV219_20950 [Methylobacterium sp. WL122]TXN83489.1 hypothetical protein FV234_05920 [Methylobacterium sp. WL8]GJD43012.1 hypothetical protein AFCDBAGC_0854 [Methylobacterium cerastii]